MPNKKNINLKSIRFWFAFVYFLSSFLLALFIVLFLLSREKTAFHINVDSDAKQLQLFYSTGNGFSEMQSILSASMFSFPNIAIEKIRLDPLPKENTNSVTFRRIELVNNKGISKFYSGEELKKKIKPINQISSVALDPISKTSTVTINGNDPHFILDLNSEELAQLTAKHPLIKRVGLKHIVILFLIMTLSSLLWLTRKKIASAIKQLSNYIDGDQEHEAPDSIQRIKPTFFSKIIDPFPSLKIYWILFYSISLFYIIMYSGSNINMLTYAVHDDALYYKLAQSIASFNWLGSYDSLTLAKVPAFAVFLAFCLGTGIPFLLLIAVSNIIAIAFLLRRSMWIFEQKKLLSFLLGIALLFNPFFAYELRIYRNQLAAICFLILLGVIIGMFNPNAKKESLLAKVFEAAIAFLGIGFLFYTRDESILYYGILFLTGVSFLLVFRKIKHIRRNLYLPTAGLLGILFFGLLFSALNYAYYGSFTTCERTSAPFTKAIQAFHSVDDPDLKPNYPKSSASREKIRAVAMVVPEFEKMAKIMCDTTNTAFRGSRYFDKEILDFKFVDNKDIPASHFEWYWIVCAKWAGCYSSAKNAAAFHANLEDKITGALKEGKLKKREVLFSSGPYSIGNGELSTILKVLPKNYNFLIKTPSEFEKQYRDLRLRTVETRNEKAKLENWSKTLNSSYLLPNETEKIGAEKKSIKNWLWNLIVTIFAFSIVPLMHLATPLALIASAIALIKKQWIVGIVILLVTSTYVANFFLLSIVDVTVGFKASTINYYLPSYSPMIITGFIVASMFISFLSSKQTS